MLVKDQSRVVVTKKGRRLVPSHLRTTADAGAYLHYLEDELHINHAGKYIRGVKFGPKGDQIRADFEKAANLIADLPPGAGRSHGGRKRKWLARVYIISTEERKGPLKNTDGDAVPVMSDKEQDFYARRFIEEARFGHAAYCWHVDAETGRCDCHIVVLNCEPDDPTRALKSWKSSVFIRRTASDRIEQEINQQRKARGEDLLTTMQQRRKQKKGAAGFEDLAVQIARISDKLVTKDNIAASIKSLGHEITRQNSQKISILHPGGKQAKRYNLAILLADVHQAQKNLNGPVPGSELSPAP